MLKERVKTKEKEKVENKLTSCTRRYSYIHIVILFIYNISRIKLIMN